MIIPDEFLGKSTGELEKILASLKEELEEVDEERMFVLSQTGYHLPGATVKKYEAEIEALRKKIEACQTVLESTRASRSAQ